MEHEPELKLVDRDSPAAKTQRLENPASSTAESEPHDEERDSPSTLDNDERLYLIDHLSISPDENLEINSSDMSDAQLDGQVDEDEDKLEGETTHHRQQQGHQENNIVPTDDDKVPSPVKSQPSSPVKAESSMRIEKSKTQTPPDTSAVDSSERNSIYHVKWINWGSLPNRSGNEGSRRIGIMTQNENGPCPLLSIVNVLLLRGKLTLPEGCEVISAEQLLEFLGEVLSESVPANLADDARLNYEQNLADAMCIMPKLQTGLDVNVHFTGVSKFEYTPECIIFDLLDIPLYHGWLIDPQQEEVCSAVNSASYNQLVEMIIANKTSKDSELVSQSLVAQQFLEESASQLTYHGLCELNATMKDGELAVFFRNNHFSTIYKRKKELFLLVTDQGFLKEPRVVWETLNSIDGDNQFVNDNFMTVTPTSEDSGEDNLQDAAALAASSAGQTANEVEQIDRDLQLAMNLAREEESEAGCDWQEYERAHLGDTTGLTDEQIALRLQAAEENLAAHEQQQRERAQLREQQQQQQQQGGTRERPRGRSSQQPQQQQQQQQQETHPRDSRSRNCTIL